MDNFVYKYCSTNCFVHFLYTSHGSVRSLQIYSTQPERRAVTTSLQQQQNANTLYVRFAAVAAATARPGLFPGMRRLGFAGRRPATRCSGNADRRPGMLCSRYAGRRPTVLCSGKTGRRRSSYRQAVISANNSSILPC